MHDGDKRCSCGAGHESFGACLRAKGIQIPPSAMTGSSITRSSVKRWENRMDAYASARAEGIQPSSTRRSDIESARQVSDNFGKAFDANNPVKILE